MAPLLRDHDQASRNTLFFPFLRVGAEAESWEQGEQVELLLKVGVEMESDSK